ncbi:MAG: hypothetical protein K0R67_2914 [Paenibacillus sp.]|nr:hypothetical protein [Paenibacillus sp.]
MNKNKAFLKAAYLQLRIYMLYILGFTFLSFLANFIVYLSIDDSENVQVSLGNMATIFLIFMAAILPLRFFRRMVNLGATRQEYYKGILVFYTAAAAVFSVFNLLFYKFESEVIREYQQTFNILEIFHWNQFGLLGMLVYQFGAYMLLISLLNLLFSGIRHYVGWILWVVLIAAIPIGTSIASYRHKVADGFTALLFNDSLWQGFGICFVLSIVFLAGGWLFTRRRAF